MLLLLLLLLQSAPQGWRSEASDIVFVDSVAVGPIGGLSRHANDLGALRGPRSRYTVR
jgi:hypothetical protein